MYYKGWSFNDNANDKKMILNTVLSFFFLMVVVVIVCVCSHTCMHTICRRVPLTAYTCGGQRLTFESWLSISLCGSRFSCLCHSVHSRTAGPWPSGWFSCLCLLPFWREFWGPDSGHHAWAGITRTRWAFLPAQVLKLPTCLPFLATSWGHHK